MFMRRTILAAATAAIAFAGLAGTALAADPSWKKDVPVIRVGILGGENDADRLARYDGFKKLLETTYNVKVELYPATDYAGVMQGMAAGQLDLAEFGASGYSGLWLDCKCVEPLVVPKEEDGSTGYYSVLYVRSDSPYQKIDDLKGKSLAFADPNSTSGYLIPGFQLKDQGYDPAKFFGSTAFAGGHEQGVVAVLKGQYDAGVTWISGQGDPAQGYSRGNLRSMVDKSMLKMQDIRILWQSSLIPNGPWATRTALPEAFRKDMMDFLMKLPTDHPDIYDAVEKGAGKGYAPVSNDFFNDIIKMRQTEASSRRS
jgi:phosphonate transport system substrate-binding protein